MNYPIPVLGISAFSGTGKTTLLMSLLPLISAQGYKFGVIKHAHDDFDVDHPNKDSHKLRHAGADKVLVTSKRRMALIEEFDQQTTEPTLDDALLRLEPNDIDIVFVEGFKNAPFPKIELHRHKLKKPLLFLNDSNVIAIISDTSMSALGIPTNSPAIKHFQIDQLEDISNFIINYIKDFTNNSDTPRGPNISLT